MKNIDLTNEQKDFQKINLLLMNVLLEAAFYLSNHDRVYKPYCLQSAAWNGIKKLRKMSPSLSEIFLNPVKKCLQTCDRTEQKISEKDMNFKSVGFSVAATSLEKLSKDLDKLLVANPSLKIGIKNEHENLVSSKWFKNFKSHIPKP